MLADFFLGSGTGVIGLAKSVITLIRIHILKVNVLS